MYLPILMIFPNILNIWLFVINRIHSLLQEGFVVPYRLVHRNLCNAHCVLFNLKNSLHRIKVWLVHCYLSPITFPSYLYYVCLFSNPSSYQLYHVIHFMRIDCSAPACSDTLTSIDQHQRQYGHVINWLY